MFDDTWVRDTYKTDIKPTGYYTNNISILKEKLLVSLYRNI